MADSWREAVASGDAERLSDLVLEAAGGDNKPEAALSLLKSCVQVLLARTTTAAAAAVASSAGGLEDGERPRVVRASLLWGVVI